jgi:hypothetical protein
VFAALFLYVKFALQYLSTDAVGVLRALCIGAISVRLPYVFVGLVLGCFFVSASEMGLTCVGDRRDVTGNGGKRQILSQKGRQPSKVRPKTRRQNVSQRHFGRACWGSGRAFIGEKERKTNKQVGNSFPEPTQPPFFPIELYFFQKKRKKVGAYLCLFRTTAATTTAMITAAAVIAM